MKRYVLISTINIVLLILTPLGYLALAPGILLHVTLGVFQMVIFGCLLWELKELSPIIRKLLGIYSIGLVIVIAVTLIDFDSYAMISWIGSYVLATYFAVILVIVKNQKLNKQEGVEN